MARPLVVATQSASSPGRHIVATPQLSVRPYAVSTVVKPSSVRIRSISSTGTTAAPVTASRSGAARTSAARSSRVW